MTVKTKEKRLQTIFSNKKITIKMTLEWSSPKIEIAIYKKCLDTTLWLVKAKNSLKPLNKIII